MNENCKNCDDSEHCIDCKDLMWVRAGFFIKDISVTEEVLKRELKKREE